MPRVALSSSPDTKIAPYVAALKAAGLEVERILPGDSRPSTDFDGLVLAGGADVNPVLYGDPRHPKTEQPDDARDITEKRLIEEALQADLPVLAICRGMQMLNVALGGGLIQHLPTTDVHQRRGVPDAHDVSIQPNTRLAAIIGDAEVSVNSRHHQAVSPDRLAPGLSITARCSGDGVAEAMELPDHAFVVAVQWHPEDRVGTHDSDRRLFEAFAGAVSRQLRGVPQPAPAPASTRT